jgi:hypothetical protein
MLIPQFTIRRLLALTTVCGCYFVVVGYAVAGHAWAIGVSLGIASLLCVFVTYALAFCVFWLLSLITWRPNRRGQGASPFASAGAPILAQVVAESPFKVDQNGSAP